MTSNHPPRSRWRLLSLFAITGVLTLAACGKSDSSGGSGSGSGGSGQKIRISSQDFSEQKTLAQVYGQYLNAQGFKADIQDPIGTRTQIISALKAGKLDLELDYTGGTLLEYKGTPTSDAKTTYAALQKALAADKLAAAQQSNAQDADALVALKSYAKSKGLTSISDLKKVSGTVTLGGAAECAQRDQCLKGYNGPKYGLSLQFKAVDYGPPLVEALKADEIQVAQYGTTAPEISTGQIVALKDDKGLIPAANVVPVFRTAVKSDKLTKALDTISAKITTKDLAKWNQSTDVDKEDPSDVAQKWLQDKGLL